MKPPVYKYQYPRPAIAVDLVLFGIREQKLVILSGRRAELPYKGRACLPGAYVHEEESAEDTCARKIKSIGLKPSYLEQLGTFSDPRRDPRERVVSIAYYGLIPVPQEVPSGDHKIDRIHWLEPEDAAKQSWAFDHATIAAAALQRLRAKIQYSPVSPHFLPAEFTLSELAQVYGAILGRKVDLSNLRRDLLRQDLVLPVGTRQVRGPLATTYTWNWDNDRSFFLSLG